MLDVSFRPAQLNDDDDNDDDDDDDDGVSSDFISTHFLCDVLLQYVLESIAYVSSSCEKRKFDNGEFRVPSSVCYSPTGLRLEKCHFLRPGLLERVHSRFTAEVYEHILANVMIHSARKRYPEGTLLFQQVNHPVHTTNRIQRWFTRRRDVDPVDWPPKSPDMNPIENLWATVKRIAEGLKEAYEKKDDLTVKNEVRQLVTLSFIHPDDLEQIFDRIYEDVSNEVEPIAAYIEKLYVRGTLARRRMRAVPPSYPPAVWNVPDIRRMVLVAFVNQTLSGSFLGPVDNFSSSTDELERRARWEGTDWNCPRTQAAGLGPYYYMEWNGMEWNGMEWNGMEWMP
ncbi:hypothetical protein ANN_10726 [Periplaneta americana]|uniref:Tc1-like transposase DDE domain-containing protein n=1 Tax=Periplaneta americana TaxID=6978 RepID=A0ABQ8T340_PERAM|nr:hypothetical protein ANN_10726 [Periplaneta americana]